MAEEGEVFHFFYKEQEFAFINELKHYLEELQCPVCREILVDPVQTSCGHSFCSKCLGARNRRLRCHVCRSTCNVTEDHKEARRVKNLQVKCPNYSNGCEWKGTLGDSLQHCDQCLYEVIHCPNLAKGCAATLQRVKMQDHTERYCEKRMYQCHYCHGVDLYSVITGKHLQECHRYPLSCPNHCGETEIPRENVGKHREKCLNEVLPCKFGDIGCTEMVQRRSLQEHLETEKDQHLDHALTKTAEMTVQFKKLRAQMTQLQLEERLAALEQQNAQLLETVTQLQGRQGGSVCQQVRRQGEPKEQTSIAKIVMASQLHAFEMLRKSAPPLQAK